MRRRLSEKVQRAGPRGQDGGVHGRCARKVCKEGVHGGPMPRHLCEGDGEETRGLGGRSQLRSKRDRNLPDSGERGTGRGSAQRKGGSGPEHQEWGLPQLSEGPPLRGTVGRSLGAWGSCPWACSQSAQRVKGPAGPGLWAAAHSQSCLGSRPAFQLGLGLTCRGASEAPRWGEGWLPAEEVLWSFKAGRRLLVGGGGARRGAGHSSWRERRPGGGCLGSCGQRGPGAAPEREAWAEGIRPVACSPFLPLFPGPAPPRPGALGEPHTVGLGRSCDTESLRKPWPR